MNERIKLLVEQAQDWADAHAPYASEEQEYFAEKFAKLIVRECIDIIDEEGSHEGGSIRSMEKIREHFGVEE